MKKGVTQRPEEDEVIHMPPSRDKRLVETPRCVTHNKSVRLEFDEACFVDSTNQQNFEGGLPTGGFVKAEKTLHRKVVGSVDSESLLVCVTAADHHISVLRLTIKATC